MMHVVCTTDSNYVMPTGVMIKSLSVNNNEERIVFHIVVDESVTTQQKKELNRVLCENPQHSLLFHLVDDTLFDDFPQLGASNPKLFITKATYYRLLFAEILPDSINKVIYLDCDMIVLGSIAELWNIDISHYALAAVTDMSERIHKETATILLKLEVRKNEEDEIVVERESGLKGKTKVEKVGRNDPCPCGSGKKYKHCCGKNQE